VEEWSYGSKGVLAKFSAPIIGESLPKALDAGKSSNPIAKTRNAVVGAMRTVIDSYDNAAEGEFTVADLIAFGLRDVLSGIDVLQDDKSITTTYYEVDECGTIIHESEQYDKEKKIKSLMWTIPLGKDLTFYVDFTHILWNVHSSPCCV